MCVYERDTIVNYLLMCIINTIKECIALMHIRGLLLLN